MPRSEPIKAVRGVRDLLPRDRPLWRAAELAAVDVARRFGYEEITTPLIEHAELIERVGEDTDAVAKELYRFEDRGGRKLALRPEATAGVVRAYFEGHLNQEPQPARLYLIGPMFRYNRPQKGRYRQFFQLDVEAIGSGSPALDAEVIEIASAASRPSLSCCLTARSRSASRSRWTRLGSPTTCVRSVQPPGPPSGGCSMPPASSTTSILISCAASTITRAPSSRSIQPGPAAPRMRLRVGDGTTASRRRRDGRRLRAWALPVVWTGSPRW